MIVLGIDPGSRFTGYGVIRRRGSRLSTVDQGRIALDPRDEVCERLAALAAGVEALLDQHEPDAVAVESLFHGLNSRSLIVLAQARGAILSVLGKHQIEPAEYSPAEIKAAITGNGRADKEQVARMVGLLLGERARSQDASDALALALTYAQRYRLDGLRGSRSGEPARAPVSWEELVAARGGAQKS